MASAPVASDAKTPAVMRNLRPWQPWSGLISRFFVSVSVSPEIPETLSSAQLSSAQARPGDGELTSAVKAAEAEENNV